MFKKLLYILLTVSALVTVAQSPADSSLYLEGGILVGTGQSITFKVILKDLKANSFEGISITDFEGDDYTESQITGRYNSKKKTLSFKELKNTNTISTAEESSFCYVQADELTLKRIRGKSLLTGRFYGKFPNGDTCAKGILLLASPQDIHKTLKKNSKVKPNKTSPETNTTPAIIPEPVTPSVRSHVDVPEDVHEVKLDTSVFDLVLTANEDLQVNEWSESIFIEVWDGDVEDRDVIDVIVNGKILQGGILLKNEKISIPLPGHLKEFTVKILARSEGFSGVNTVNFQLTNTSERQSHLSELNKGESFTISFKKE